jgi:hypothetical protein
MELKGLLKEREVWTDEHEERFKALTKELDALVEELRAGGIKLLDARQLCFKIADKRDEIANLNNDKNVLDLSTAEAQAETARFNWFVVNSTVYSDTGKPLFAKDETPDDPDVSVYSERSIYDYAQECARRFGELQYGLTPDFRKKFPENQFLLKYKFAREDLRLIDRNKNLIDREGHLVNEKGQRIDKDGSVINRVGVPIEDDGTPKIKGKPFLDDEGNPVEEPALV